MAAATLDTLPPILCKMHAPRAERAGDAWVAAIPKRPVVPGSAVSSDYRR